jgi:hypothetical protein
MENFDFRTKDIYLASALITSGYDYLLRKEGIQFSFCFIDKKDAIQIDVDNYWNGNLLLDPKKVFDAFKQLKTRINDY